MKILSLILTISLFSSFSLANISSDNRFLLNRMNSVAQKVQLGQLIDQTSGTLVAKYSFAVQGGKTTAAISLLTDLTKPTSYAVLPNKAIITNAWVQIVTAPTSSGAATVRFDSNASSDLLTATSIQSLQGPFLQGVPAGATTGFIKLTADRTIKMVLGTGLNVGLTAGKFDVVIDYIIGD